MITVIRRHIKSEYSKILLWALIAIMGIVLVMPDFVSRSPHPEWVIQINGEKVPFNRFARSVVKHESNIRMIKEQYGAYAPMFLQMLGLTQDPKVVALDELLREELMNTVVKNIPLFVQKEYADQVFHTPHLSHQQGLFELFPLGLFKENGIDQELLYAYMSRSQISMSQLEPMVQGAIARRIAYELAGLAAYAPAYMLQDALDSNYAIRDYTVLSIPLHEIKKELLAKEVSSDELQAFFKKETGRYMVPEMRSATVWEFSPKEYGLVVSEDELQEAYETNKIKNYLVKPAQVEVRHILIKFSETEPKELTAQRAQDLHKTLVENPGAFEAKARELSDDKETAAQGGKMPFFAKGERDARFERKAFTLKQDGDISEPFETTEGYEIVQRVSKKAPEYKEFAQVKQAIHDQLLKQKFARAFSKDLKRVIDRTGIDEAALGRFVEEKKSQATEQALAPKDNSKRMQVLFKLKKGEADFYTENDKGYIVQVRDIKKRYTPTLDTVEKEVTADFINDKAEQLLHERLYNALKELKSAAPEELAQKYGASLRQFKAVDPLNEVKKKELQEAGLPVEQLLQIEKAGEASVAFTKDTGYLMVASGLTKQQVDQEKLDQLKKRLADETKALVTQGFVASLLRNAKIETNESLFTQTENQAI